MSARRNWSRREPWTVDAEFHVPSIEPGIAFQVELQLRGVRTRRLTEHRAQTLALGLVVKATAVVARNYSVLSADAAALAATAACLTVEHQWRDLEIEEIAKLKLSCEGSVEAEASQMEVLRRTAQIAGEAAVLDAARAYALRHVVLDDHTTTVAYLLFGERYSGALKDLPNTAAELRRLIDDYRPERRWIRVAEALGSLIDRKRQNPEQIRDMLQNLADWAGHYDKPLAESIGDVITAGEESPANSAGPSD